MTRRLAGAMVVVLAIGALWSHPSSGQSQPEGNRTISGTIRGIDGRFVNAQISLVLRRSDGTFIGLDGNPSPPGRYAAVISMNPAAPIDGLETGGDETWSFTGIPS